MLQLVPAFVFLNQRLVFQLREIVRYCSLQLVVVTVASDWMAYAMRRRFGLAWFGVSAASFFASAAIPVNSRRFRWLFCSCEVALDSSREALSSYTIFGSFVGWIESAKLLFLRVISSLQICAGSELLRSLRKLREHCDVLSMQIDSDLVIYRTTLVRTFQVVTIYRVDKSEVLVVLISPHYSKLH
ncbi:hypothetical protein F511_19457 [Dorcoceras hygrometricum]|uniref:Uncharacterized protein n=1 Tax=Dorcoceras hygrometricum TaxID=472368 RepID=A0A2Z6ZYH8_9LAMI|nr:hypothetical protein F511_19457 [Dorcoceras hygrometricum]